MLARERSADVAGSMRNIAGTNLRKSNMAFWRNWLPATSRDLTFSGISVSNFKVTSVAFTEMKLVVGGHVSANRESVNSGRRFIDLTYLPDHCLIHYYLSLSLLQQLPKNIFECCDTVISSSSSLSEDIRFEYGLRRPSVLTNLLGFS